MKIILPQDVINIINALEKEGFQGFAVGGCIRDSILLKVPKDWDITTDALPEKLLSIFPKTIPTGLKHGTVTVVINKINYEITTFRIDGEYIDKRHPEEVTFTKSIVDDLSRRDFTINSIAYNDTTGIVDPFKGLEDIHSKVIRCVGNPNTRFDEDALRMLRAIRFSCQLNFTIEKDTFEAIEKNHKHIANISYERIRDELTKILLSDTPSHGIKLLRDSKLLSYVIPELLKSLDFNQHNVHHDKNLFDHVLSVLDNTPKNLVLRLAALLHDIAKPECFSIDSEGNGHFYLHHIKGAELSEKILKRLRYDNEIIKKVSILIREHCIGYDIIKEKSIKKLISRIGEDNIELLLKLMTADVLGHKPPHNFNHIQRISEFASKIESEKQPVSIKDLKINGNDLKALGLSEGKEIGMLLNHLLELALDNPLINTREELLSISKDYILKKYII